MREKDLWKKMQYEPPFNFLFNGNIQEYDISKANINMLKAYDMITDDEYNNLYLSEKHIRETIVGNMERENRELIKIIQNGIIESKLALFLANDIQDEEVVRIANDSVYVNRPMLLTNPVVTLNSGYQINFALKNVFTSMVRLGKVLIFLNSCGPDNQSHYIVDIKGISKEKHELHSCFVSMICTMIESIERGSKNDVLRLYHDFYDRYINLDLPIEYYREFKASSCFRIKGRGLGCEFLDESHKKDIDIQHNLYCLREFYKIIMQY